MFFQKKKIKVNKCSMDIDLENIFRNLLWEEKYLADFFIIHIIYKSVKKNFSKMVH